MPWLSLMAHVDDGEHAEALSDALLEGGAQSVSVDGLDGARPSVTALLAVDADPADALRRATALAGLAGVPAFSVGHVPDDDWVRRSQAQFVPLVIGERLWVGPTWHQPPCGARTAVRIDPGRAFGTGSHPSTRLALCFVEETVRGAPSVLDYGCGSGILAIAAAKLGAAPVDAVDLDPEAVEVTAANALANAVRVRALPPDVLPAARYDIVVANILAQPLIVLAPLLSDRVAPGGRIALSGILASQADEVASAYRERFDVRARLEEGWALLEGVRR